MRGARWALLMILILAFIFAGSLTSWPDEQLQVTAELVCTLVGHTNWVNSVAFGPGGQLLASGDNDGRIKLWEVTTGNLVRTINTSTPSVFSIAFSPDGKLLASGGGHGNKTVKLWNVTTGSLVRTLTGHTDFIYSVAFSPDGKYLASGSMDKTIKIWKVATGREVRTLTGHTGAVQSVAFSPDGKLLASGSSDTTIILWEVDTGHIIHTLRGHANYVPSVAFSPDGKLLASSSCKEKVFGPPYCRKGEIKLWEVATAREVLTITGHTNSIDSIAFGPEGRLLASGSNDTTVKLWEVATGRELLTLQGHTGYVNSVAFSPDGRLLASGSHDKTIKLWEIQVEEKNQPPQASFTFSPAKPKVGQSVKFDASGSSDPDGNIVNYEWDSGDGSTGSGKITTHTYNHSGSFTVTLTVTDDDGATDSTSKRITVIKANEPPRAKFTYSPEKPLVGQRVTFNASTSSNPDGHIVLYEWNFGDESGKNYGMIVTHIFSKAGTYKVKLTVTDDDGATASVEQEVKVLESGGGGGPA